MHNQNFAETIRSEERLDVTRLDVPVERVRLIKHIVVETRTIEVRREELRVVREPIAPGEMIDPTKVRSTAVPIDIVLYQEEVLLRPEPRERVKVIVERVDAGAVDVSDSLRREEIAVDDRTADLSS